MSKISKQCRHCAAFGFLEKTGMHSVHCLPQWGFIHVCDVRISMFRVFLLKLYFKGLMFLMFPEDVNIENSLLFIKCTFEDKVVLSGP